MASTRSTTDVFLIGHPSPSFPPGLLPSNIDILREVLWKKDNLGGKKPLNSVISCPLEQGIMTAMCNGEEGCLKMGGDNLCTVQKVKLCWFQAGIKTIGDKQIRSNIAKLWSDFLELKARRMRTSIIHPRSGGQGAV